jgi:GDP-mannose 6-dehydrogenase
MIEVIEHLIGKGFDLRIYDKNVKIASLVGANRDFILNHIPHISKLMVSDTESVLLHAQTVVIGNNDPEFKRVPERLVEGQKLVDFVRVIEGRSMNGKYDGFSW